MRVYNFSAGPAVLPEEVLKEAAEEMKKAKDIVFKSYGPDGEVTVSVFFVNVVDIEGSLEELRKKLI